MRRPLVQAREGAKAVVEIEYTAPKASLLLPNDPRSWIQILNRDLTRLGCPHPKKTNVVLVAPGRLTFLWITYMNSALHKSLHNALAPTVGIREQLSICYLALEIRSPDYLLPDPYTPPPDSPAVLEQTKSANTPVSPLPSKTPITSDQPLVKIEVVDPALSLPITQQLAVRPVGLIAPDPPSDDPSVGSTQQMTPPNGSPEIDNPHSNAQAPAAHSPLAQPTLKRPASRSLTPSNRQPINPAELQAQLNTQPESIAPAEQQLRDEQDAIQKPPIYSPSPSLPPASDVGSKPHIMSLAPRLMTQLVPRSKLEEIEGLLRDERESRTKAEADKQIAIAKLRSISQQGIVAQMGRLDAESKHRSELSLRTVAEKSLADAENALAHERDLRIQAERGLRDMRTVLEGDRQLRIEAEQRLAGEQRSRITAEQNLAGTKDELRYERQLRTQAESCLTDIERECRHPFVVPAMLSAFKIVSALTSQQVIPKS